MNCKGLLRSALASLTAVTLLASPVLASLDLTQGVKSTAPSVVSMSGAKFLTLANAAESGPLGQLLKKVLSFLPEKTLAQMDGALHLRAFIDNSGDPEGFVISAEQPAPLAVEEYASIFGLGEEKRTIDGLAEGLQVIGVDSSINDPDYLALATRPDGTWFLAGPSVDALNAMAAWQGPDKENKLIGDLHASAVISPELLAKDNPYVSAEDFKAPLKLEAATRAHPSALTLQLWMNTKEANVDLFPFSDELPKTIPLTNGSTPAAILSMENSWIPADLSLDALKIPEEEKKEIIEGLEQLKAMTGATWKDIVALLRGPILVAHSSDVVQSAFGPVPATWIHLGGFRAEIAQALLPMAQMVIKEQVGLPVESVTSGEWTGLVTGEGAPMTVWLVYGPQGLLLTNVDPSTLAPAKATAENASLFKLLGLTKDDGTPVSPESSEALVAPLTGMPHSFLLALRSDALAELVAKCKPTLDALGAADDVEDVLPILQMVRDVVFTGNNGLMELEVTPTQAGMAMLMMMLGN